MFVVNGREGVHPSGRAPERVSEAVPPKKKFTPVKLWRDGETMMAESELELEEALDDGWSDEEPKTQAKPPAKRGS